MPGDYFKMTASPRDDSRKSHVRVLWTTGLVLVAGTLLYSEGKLEKLNIHLMSTDVPHMFSIVCTPRHSLTKLHSHVSATGMHIVNITTTATTVLRPFFRDYPGELVPEEKTFGLYCAKED